MNTNKLEEFGFREVEEAAQLLTAYVNDGGCDFLWNGIKLEFNQNSGLVFLADEDCNVGVMENGKLVQFKWCNECGYEGTDDDYKCDKENGNTQECCKEYFEEVEEDER
jgi:hypothetical protein|tara:strand:+ start:6844 stop:7170 length:327 start_codon:yes stop_codon:yes gene_type:complete